MTLLPAKRGSEAVSLWCVGKLWLALSLLPRFAGRSHCSTDAPESQPDATFFQPLCFRSYSPCRDSSVTALEV